MDTDERCLKTNNQTQSDRAKCRELRTERERTKAQGFGKKTQLSMETTKTAGLWLQAWSLWMDPVALSSFTHSPFIEHQAFHWALRCRYLSWKSAYALSVFPAQRITWTGEWTGTPDVFRQRSLQTSESQMSSGHTTLNAGSQGVFRTSA